jgi:hypothetical protein
MSSTLSNLDPGLIGVFHAGLVLSLFCHEVRKLSLEPSRPSFFSLAGRKSGTSGNTGKAGFKANVN